MEYLNLFERNIGIFKEKEQERLRKAKVAIAGLGGVGGIVFERLVRLGIENFTVADPEKFELNNFNRQVYSNLDTLEKNKTEVLVREMKRINPNIKVKYFIEGINEENIDDFVDADIVIDAIEYNLPYLLFLLHRTARRKNKIVLAAQAIGFGATLFVFNKDSINFEDYIELKNPEKLSKDEINKYKIPMKKFCPNIPKYIPKTLALKVYLRKTYIPSCSLGVMAAASLIEVVSIKQILGKGKIRVVPDHYKIDLYSDSLWGDKC